MVVFWKRDFDSAIDSYSPNHVDGIINKGKEDEWCFIDYYGEPDTSNHHVLWSTMRRLKLRNSIPCLCVGDFNEITRSHEKLGGRLRLVRQMQDFRDLLDECGFKDLGFEGGKCTWCNG